MSNTSWTSPHNGSAVAGGGGGGGGDDSWLKPDEPADAGEVLVLSAASSSSNHFSVQDGDPNDDAPAAEKSTGKKCGKSTVLFAFSSLFLAVFIIYSAVVQNNDDDSLLWLFFYALHATIPCTFLAHYFVCFPNKIVYGLCASMTIYSISLLVIGAIDLSKSNAGGAKVGTGDEDKRTLQEELIFEVAGAGLGLVSALYHMMATKCCVTKKEVPEYKGGEEGAAEGPVV